jgi:hypothetical protein
MVGEGAKVRGSRVVWLVVAAVLVGACGGAGEDSVGTPGRLPQHLLDRIAQAEGMVAEILADEWVTDAELGQAFYAALACIEEAGFDVDGHIDWTMASYNFDLHGMETSESQEAATATMDECIDEHLDLVAAVHFNQGRLSEQEVTERFRLIAECLRRNGVTVRFDTPESVFAATEDGRAAILYGECYRAVVGG